MSDAAAPAAPAKKVAKAKNPAAKAKPTHPAFTEMITVALTTLKEKKGSNLFAIKILANNKVEEKSVVKNANKSLKRLVEKGAVVQNKGKFKLAEKPKVAKKPAAKKAAKKPAAKKAAKPAKKDAKSPAMKAKKPAAKKQVKIIRINTDPPSLLRRQLKQSFFHFNLNWATLSYVNSQTSEFHGRLPRFNSIKSL